MIYFLYFPISVTMVLFNSFVYYSRICNSGFVYTICVPGDEVRGGTVCSSPGVHGRKHPDWDDADGGRDMWATPGSVWVHFLSLTLVVLNCWMYPQISITGYVTSRSRLTAWLQPITQMLAMIAQEVCSAHVGAQLSL